MLAADPVVSILVDALARVAPPIPGRTRLLARYHAKRGGMFEVMGGVANALQMSEWFQWLTTPGLQLSALNVPRPEYWAAMMSYFGFSALPDGEFDAAGERHGTYWREWRDQSPRDAAVQRLSEQGERRDGGLRRGAVAPVSSTAGQAGDAPLDRGAFAKAVREALRHVRRDAQLAESPLLRTRLVRAAQRPSEKPAAVLRRVLVVAAQEQRDTPRHEKGWRALDLTYFRPAGTQELAAERLGLPFNTYRYQLNAGVQRLTDRLWELELAAAGAER